VRAAIDGAVRMWRTAASCGVVVVMVVLIGGDSLATLRIVS
jgi:hypothetical protein